MADDEVIYRPERPPHPHDGPDWRDGRYYQVTQAERAVAAYNSTYFRSINAVLSDLLALIKDGSLSGPWTADYVVWRGGRVQGVIHEVGAVARLWAFREPGNDPGPAPPLPGWPGYEERAAERESQGVKTVEIPPDEIKDPGEIGETHITEVELVFDREAVRAYLDRVRKRQERTDRLRDWLASAIGPGNPWISWRTLTDKIKQAGLTTGDRDFIRNNLIEYHKTTPKIRIKSEED
jgi:hypothetical protein